MKTLLFIIVITLITANGMARAEMPGHDRAKMSQTTAAQARHEGRGVIKSIKGDSVQLAHEAIPTLRWSAMTMWFPLLVPLPAELKVGDSVRFELVQDEKQQWVIGKIARSPAGK